MDTLSRMITKIDFLGTKHSPTFKNQSRVHTCLGGLLSIVFCIVISVGTFFLGKELYERKNPLSNLSEAREAVNEINLEDIQALFSISDVKGRLMNKNRDFLSSVDITAVILQLEATEDNQFLMRIIKIPVVECEEALLSRTDYELLTSSGTALEMYMCLDKSNPVYIQGSEVDNPLIIRNKSGSIGSSMFAFQINKCDSKKRSDCVDAFNSPYYNVHMMIKTAYLDITDYNSPIKSTFQEFYEKVTPDEERSSVFTFKINELNTDTGHVFSSTETQQYFTVDSVSKEYSKYSETQRTILHVYFEVSMMRNIITRKYMKLQELLANVGGFVKAMMIIVSLALKLHCECTLINAIKTEKNRIEGKTYLSPQSSINNFTQDKTVSTMLKNESEHYGRISFFTYLKTIIPFARYRNIKSEIESNFAYFDILTILNLSSKITKLTKMYSELIEKANKN